MRKLKTYHFGVTILCAMLKIGIGSSLVPLRVDRTEKRSNVTGSGNVTILWVDSYSVGANCYCASTLEHGFGEVMVVTPMGSLTIKQVCQLLGPGPGKSGRPVLCG